MEISIIINVALGVTAAIVGFVSYFFYIKSVIVKAASGAIENAEIEGKIGEEKLEIATEQVYSIVPTFLKGIINRDIVKNIVQEIFEKIEAYAKKQVNKKQEKNSNDKNKIDNK